MEESAKEGSCLDRVFTEIYSELQTWCLHSFFRLVAMQGISAGFINKTEDFVTSWYFNIVIK